MPPCRAAFRWKIAATCVRGTEWNRASGGRPTMYSSTMRPTVRSGADSGVRARQFDMEKISFYLNDVLDEVAARVRSATGDEVAGKRVSVGSDVPRSLTGDQAGLARILSDLIRLGCECSSSRKVFVDVGLADKESDSVGRSANLRIAVRDTGAGLTCGQAVGILLKFLGGGSPGATAGTPHAHVNGTELVDRMGAGVAVEKTEENSFVVSLTAEFGIGTIGTGQPTARDEAPARRDAKPELRMPDGLDRLRGARILLAEDHPVNQNLTREILHQAGCSVDITEDGQATVDAVRKRGDLFDAILMDIQMPVMDGFEATRRIRNDLGRPELPIIAMTANVLGDERQRCLEAGMDDYVPKPIHIPNIYAALLRWIKPHQPQPATEDETAVAANGDAASADADDVYLPDRIPAIDIRSGLSRAMGNRALYAQLLAQFARGNETVGKEVAMAIARGDPEKARFLVHGLASTAGNIGAANLYAAACELEKALVKRGDDTGTLLPTFQDRLQQVLSGIRESGVSMDSGPVRLGDGAEPFDRDEAVRMADTLLAMLEDQDLAAHEQAERLLELFGGRGRDEDLRSLMARLEALEFAEAKRILAGLCEDMLN